MLEILLSGIRAWFSTITLSIIVFYVTWHYWNKRTPGSPPGPRGFPFIGAITSIRKHPEHVMTKWNKEYGPVCMVRLGFKDVLVIGSYEAAHEAYVKSQDFLDRPSPFGLEILGGGYGLFPIAYGSFHQEQRRFGLNTLREHGMGRRVLESTILQYAEELCDRLETKMSSPVLLDQEVYIAVSSTIAHIVFGHNTMQDNPEFRDMVLWMLRPSTATVLAGILVFAPYLKHLPFFRGVHNDSRALRLKIESLNLKEVKEHDRTRDPSDPRDFIDSFLNEMDKRKRKNSKQTTETPSENHPFQNGNGVSKDNDDEDFKGKIDPNWETYSSFSDQQLVSMVRDLFLAGTDTTSATTCWIILFLCKYPDVQRRMQKEIDDVIGENGIPKLALAEKLPFTRAVIQEIGRIRPNVPLAVPHCASRDSTLMGFNIPKDTIIMTNIWGIHHDEKTWKDPYKFNPDRHLDADGNFVKSNHVMQFNIGLRSCLGQQLARMELFLITVTLFRKFSIELEPGCDIDMEGESLVSLRPYPFKVLLTKRI
ncbi:cytochrome P450 2D15-like [Ciona intestinalis]